MEHLDENKYLIERIKYNKFRKKEIITKDLESGDFINMQNNTMYLCLICNDIKINANKITLDCDHDLCIFCLEKMRLYANKKHLDLVCPYCRNVIEKAPIVDNTRHSRRVRFNYMTIFVSLIIISFIIINIK